MFAAFFESIKYVGHLVPIAFLRIFLGYLYLQSFILRFHSDFLTRPRLASEVAEVLPTLQVANWYKNFLEIIFIPHWQSFAVIVVGLELAIALSYLLGYVVRPLAVIAAMMALQQLVVFGSTHGQEARLLLAVHLLLAWIGAGRCLGFDYYFFKRQRGLWW